MDNGKYKNTEKILIIKIRIRDFTTGEHSVRYYTGFRRGDDFIIPLYGFLSEDKNIEVIGTKEIEAF